MRILMLCSKFSLVPGDDYLTNELAEALVAEGHKVQVVLLDWVASASAASRRIGLPSGLDVLALPSWAMRGFGAQVERGTKWTLSPILAQRAFTDALSGHQFDLLIAFSPACTMSAQIRYALRRLCRRSYLVIWDFFPFHHRSIGLITNPLVFRIARQLEEGLIRRFDVIGCMSPMNETYLRRNYRLRPTQRTALLPIWGPNTQPEPKPRDAVRSSMNLPLDKKIVVFGGQLTEGRGVEDVLAAAALARRHFPDLVFLFIGSGRLAGLVRSAIKSGADNVVYLERIPRASYLDVLTACDAGLVCTVRDVDVPTFPSKIIDYLRAGLPVVASVEASTDFAAFVEKEGLGVSCLAGDAEGLRAAVSSLIADAQRLAKMRRAARRCLEEVFDVRLAARSIVTAFAAPESPS